MHVTLEMPRARRWTLDPSPARRSRSPATAIAGGVGDARDGARVARSVVDLGGRCVVPGFTDAHVHFPTWAVAQRQVRLEGTRSLEEALARVRDALGARPGGGGSAAAAGGAATGRRRRADAESLDEVTGDVPVALIARDSHSLWLNSAALARANGDLEVPGGVVERDERGEPTGVLREESAWQFRDLHVAIDDAEYVDAMRAGLQARSRARRHRRARQGRLARRARGSGSGCDARRRARRCASGSRCPHERVGELRALGVRSGFGDDWLRLGYLKAFMDGTLGSQTARCSTARASRSRAREELAEIVRRGAAAGWPVAVHAIGDRANRDALDAFEATRDDLGAARTAAADRARAAARAGGRRRGSRELGVAASVQFSHATSDRDLAERFWAEPPRRRLRVPLAARLRRGGRERLGRADRGARPARRDPRRRPADARRAPRVAARAGGDRRAGARRRRASRRPGWRATSAAAASCSRATWPTSSCSTATRSTCPPDELPDVQVVATMVGGRWVHNPPPWDYRRASPPGMPSRQTGPRPPPRDERTELAVEGDDSSVASAQLATPSGR